MIDWNHIAAVPAIQTLGKLLRKRYGVWVGVVHGQSVIPFSTATTVAVRPFCSLYMANPTPRGSCRQSVVSWAEASGDTVQCHVGLSSMLFPITTEEGEAKLYVSGFVPSERASDILEQLRGGLESASWVSNDENTKLLENISALDRHEREAMRAIAQELIDEIHAALDSTPPFDGEGLFDIVGSSPNMVSVFKDVARMSKSHSTVLIRGENGTGKDLLARAIHRVSLRRDHAFVAQNCAAIPKELVESELFGHKRGAFSGAIRDRRGLFEVADGGTFFLDEIGDMSLDIQSKLLRVLQEGELIRVGDEVTRKVDVRVICATHRDLKSMVEQGTFREDLYFRINVLRIEVPPLRERGEDVLILARKFVADACRRHGIIPKTITREVEDLFRVYAWPGNVRQLENQIERAVILSGDVESLDVEHFEIGGESTEEQPLNFGEDLLQMTMPDAVFQLEREMILNALKKHAWNKTKAAKALGVSRRNLIRRVASMNLESGGEA